MSSGQTQLRTPDPLRLLLAVLAGAVLAGGVAWLLTLLPTTTAIVVSVGVAGAALGAIAYVGLSIAAQLVALGGRAEKRAAAAMERLRAVPDKDATARIVSNVVKPIGDRLIKDVHYTHREVTTSREAALDDVRQLEALLNLHALVDVKGVLPASRGWAASPDLLLAYVREILDRKPTTVVECGSGLSTVWAALTLEALGGDGRVVALEHEPAYRESTLRALAAQGVAHRADVRLAPIGDADVDGTTRPWYATEALAGLSEVGVVLVDGPIAAIADQARYPALPLLRDVLVPGAVILLDDTDRREEGSVIAHWMSDWPGLRCEMLDLEKGAARIIVPD